MRMRAGAVGVGNGAIASAEVQVRNSQGGYVIAGASGQAAAAYGSIQGGKGDVITGAFDINGRRVALAVVIGSDPRQLPGQSETTLIGRAAVRRR